MTTNNNYCIDCGKDITDRGNRATRCLDCLGPTYIKHLEQRKWVQKMQRGGYTQQLILENINPSLHRAGSDGIPHQEEDEEYIKIYNGTNIKRIKKVCHDCKRDDAGIYGKWAPVYSVTNREGRELDYILLCLSCYLKRCEVS